MCITLVVVLHDSGFYLKSKICFHGPFIISCIRTMCKKYIHYCSHLALYHDSWPMYQSFQSLVVFLYFFFLSRSQILIMCGSVCMFLISTV